MLEYFTQHLHLLRSLELMLGIIVITMTLSASAKTKFVRVCRIPFELVLLALFIIGLREAILVWHSVWLGFIWTIPVAIVMAVFAFGGSIVLSQEVSYENEGIVIEQGSMVHWLLYRFAKLDGRKPRTLCSLSWLGILALIGMSAWMPVACIVLFVVGIIRLLVVGGGNPFTYPGHVLRGGRNDRDYYGRQWEFVRLKGIPTSPLLWLCIAIVVLGIYQFIADNAHTILAIVIYVALVVVGLFVLAGLFYVLFYVAIRRIPIEGAQEKPDSGGEDEEPQYVELSIADVVWSGVKPAANSIFSPMTTLIRMLKKEVCPQIIVRAKSRVVIEDR